MGRTGDSFSLELIYPIYLQANKSGLEPTTALLSQLVQWSAGSLYYEYAVGGR